MIDWGGGFFYGLKLGLIFIILGIEFYFFIVEKWTERDIGVSELSILSFFFLLAFLLGIRKTSFFSVFLVPLVYGIIFAIEHFIFSTEEKIEEKERIEKLLETIKKNPKNWAAYLTLGDIYFKKEDYEKAKYYYQLAYQLRDEPQIKQKIKIAEREDKIKKGLLWICPECGEENKGEKEKCWNCGYEKDIMRELKRSVKEKKEEIRKNILLLFLSPVIIGIIFLLIEFLPLYLSLTVTLILIYVILRLFFEW